jgi:hypothetical protein
MLIFFFSLFPFSTQNTKTFFQTRRRDKVTLRVNVALGQTRQLNKNDVTTSTAQLGPYTHIGR